MLNEPSAAALSLSSKIEEESCTLMVYDFGGGTFDVSVLTKVGNTFVVEISGGDMNLGGRDIDEKFKEVIYKKGNLPVDPTSDLSALKEKLCKGVDQILFPLAGSNGEEKNVEVTLNMLNEVSLPYIARTCKIMTETFNSFADTNAKRDKGCYVVLIGGSSLLPMVRSEVAKLPFVKGFKTSSDSRSAVAAGCAMYAENFSDRPSVLLVDCATHSVGITNTYGEMIVTVAKGAPLPFKGRREINLVSVTRDSSFSPVVFEGDFVKCVRNRSICRTSVRLSALGFTNTIPSRETIVMDFEISSVGNISVSMGTRSGKINLSSVPAYVFDNQTIPPRSVVESYKQSYSRVLTFLILTSKIRYRQKLTPAHKLVLNDFTNGSRYESLINEITNGDADERARCETLMGQPLPQVLRGTRLEKFLV